MPVHSIQDCWIVLNDTYIGSFAVILFPVKNAHSDLEVGCAYGNR